MSSFEAAVVSLWVTEPIVLMNIFLFIYNWFFFRWCYFPFSWHFLFN